MMLKTVLTVLILSLVCHEQILAASVKTLNIPPKSRKQENTLDWWQETMVYQIYPRSMKDSDGDGVGDIPGIEASLDYLVSLGVGAVWISPIYKSPMKDFGYDISDFKDIDPIFGNLEQFESMSAAMKERDIKLIMDFVPNHSSDQHEWFQKSIQREDPYTDYYMWRDANGTDAQGNPIPPNNWLSVFHGSAWKWVEEREQFYYHAFVAEQPDLNYTNPLVVAEMLDAMKFWLDKGVDGFRVDAVPWMYEEEHLMDEPLNPNNDGSISDTEYGYLLHPYTYNLPKTLETLAEFRKIVDIYSLVEGKTKIMMVEASMDTFEQLFEYYGTPEKPIAHFPFNFELIYSINSANLNGTTLLNLLTEWFDKLPDWAWSNWLVGNHDQKRVSKRYGNDPLDALNTIVLLLPGTSVTYYGEEIGMEDTYITWEQTVDPSGCNAGPEKYEQYSRDPCRTPMQWNASLSAGFSTSADTWLPVNPNYQTLNVEAQLAAPESHIKAYKAISDLRKTEAWKYGGLQAAAPNNGQVFGFTRILEDGTGLLFLSNFGNLLVTVNAEQTFQNVPPSAIVAARNVGFVPTTSVIGSSLTTGNIVVGAKSSLVLTF